MRDIEVGRDVEVGRDIEVGRDVEVGAVYAIPTATRFRGISVREGVLLRGRAGWGEFCPFPEYGDAEAAGWLAAALEAATVGWPAAIRQSVPVNVTVPALPPDRAHRLALDSGCRTAKVKVADPGGTPGQDEERVAAVRSALGPAGQIRVDANGAWDVPSAVRAIRRLDAAAGGLDYVEQPCRTLGELAQVRRLVDVRVAADESIRRAGDPGVALAGAADVAVLKCTPLGGVRRCLRLAEAVGLPVVVSSALETGVGMAAQLALAGALPELDGACGLATASLLAGDLVARPWLPVGGMLPVPARPPEPDPDLIEAFRQRDPERERWWADRLDRVLALVTG